MVKGSKEKVISFFGKGGVDSKKVKELSTFWNTWTKKYK